MTHRKAPKTQERNGEWDIEEEKLADSSRADSVRQQIQSRDRAKLSYFSEG